MCNSGVLAKVCFKKIRNLVILLKINRALDGLCCKSRSGQMIDYSYKGENNFKMCKQYLFSFIQANAAPELQHRQDWSLARTLWVTGPGWSLWATSIWTKESKSGSTSVEEPWLGHILKLLNWSPKTDIFLGFKPSRVVRRALSQMSKMVGSFGLITG